MNKKVELILLKLKVVSEEKERGLYLCNKEDSKSLLDYVKQLQERIDYLERSNNRREDEILSLRQELTDKGE